MPQRTPREEKLSIAVRRPAPPERFTLLDRPNRPPEPEALYFALPIVFAAVGCAAFSAFLLAVGVLAGGAFGWMLGQALRRRAQSSEQRRARSLTVAEDSIVVLGPDRPEVTYARRCPEGLILFASPSRARVAATLTNARGCLSFGCQPRPSERARLAGLLGEAATLREDHVLFDCVGLDGRGVILSPRDFVRLVERLVGRADGQKAVEGAILTDQSGRPVALHDRHAEARDRHMDLQQAFQWRSVAFQETYGPTLTCYQGLWLTQFGNELVLVALREEASLELFESRRTSWGELPRTAFSDGPIWVDPPPSSIRVAVEQPYVEWFRQRLRRRLGDRRDVRVAEVDP